VVSFTPRGMSRRYTMDRRNTSTLKFHNLLRITRSGLSPWH